MKSYGQRMAENNDGMDPDWKPEPSPDLNIVKQVKKLVYALADISCRFDKYDLEKLKADDHVVQVQFTPEQIRELREIVKAAR